jgi:diacylglycerol kinase (ATP)
LEKIAFIINPASGKSRNKKLTKWIHENIDPRKFEPDIIESKKPGEATEIAAERVSGGCRVVVAVGGDGTVNEVARSLINTDTLLAIIPTGSGNGLARHLKIPLSPGKAIRLINQMTWRRMDYATVNNVPFFCTTGVGFDAMVGNIFARQRKRGLVTYMKIILAEFYKYKLHQYRIEMNGDMVEREAFLITIANSSQYGNNAYIAPGADVEDGLLDLCIISKFPNYKVWELGIRMATKKLPSSPYYEVFKVKEAKISSVDQTFIHYDGEAGGSGNEIEIQVFSKGLKVIVPSEDPAVNVQQIKENNSL